MMDPKRSKILESQDNKGIKRIKITSSDRRSIRRKAICTASEDDGPSAKKTKTFKSMQEGVLAKEKEYLRKRRSTCKIT